MRSNEECVCVCARARVWVVVVVVVVVCESWFGGIGWSDGRCFPKTSINECCLLLNLIRFHAYGNTEIIEICMCFAGVLGEGMLKSKK